MNLFMWIPWLLSLVAHLEPAAAAVQGSPVEVLLRVHVASGKRLWNGPLGMLARAAMERSEDVRQLRGALLLAGGYDPALLAGKVLSGELLLTVYAGRTREGSREGKRSYLAAARTSAGPEARRAVEALASFAMTQGAHVRHHRYRDVRVTAVDDNLVLALLDDVVLVASHKAHLRAALDALLDGQGPLLDGLAPDVLARIEVSTERLRQRDVRALGRAGRRLREPERSPLAALLLGALPAAVREARPLVATLYDEGLSLTLETSLPLREADVASAYLPSAAGAPAAVPVTPDTLAVLYARRDMADWWRNREQLLAEKVQPGLARFDRDLSVLFAGLSPAEDIFARLAPELALVVDRQRFEDAADVPTLRLPAACLVARLDDAVSFGPSLQVFFQTLIGAINTERGQEGEAPFLLDSERVEGTVIRWARLVPQAAGDGTLPGAVDFNFRPALAVVDRTLLLGTSVEQVRGLVHSIRAGEFLRTDDNLMLDIDIPLALEVARDNRAALIAQTILEDGLDPTEAGAQVDTLLDLLAVLDSTGVQLRQTPDGLALGVTLRARVP